MAEFALAGALALLSHYFAVFLLIPMVIWLLWERSSRRAALPAAGALAIVGLALIPLISAQGGHGTQWIGRWPLSERLQAIPQYYLTGYSGAPLGHGVELLIALAVLAGLALGLWSINERSVERARNARASGALIALSITACGVLIPVALVAFGADYLAPRNLVGAMVPLTALIAVVLARCVSTRLGLAIVVTIALAFLVISVDVDLSPRLQRGDWRGVAHALRGGASERAITSVELGSAPLEYYIGDLHNLAPATSVRVREIDETGYAPLRPSAGVAPARGFHLLARLDVNGLIVYRFVSAVPRRVSEATLRRHVITRATPEVLIPAGIAVSTHLARLPGALARLSSSGKKI